jgi:hypothetical protein
MALARRTVLISVCFFLLCEAATGEILAYPDQRTNLIYNLLFCDQPELFAKADLPTDSNLAEVLSSSATPDAVRKIAENDNTESRIRVLAFNWLRAHRLDVPRKKLLGVIVEMPLAQGLDTLAAYPDGRVRYINQSGKMAFFESPISGMPEKVTAFMSSAQIAVNQTGPWDKARLPPPPQGFVRFTFLVSDGLYFGQGKVDDIARDKLGGPILKSATALLLLVTNAPQK